MNGISRMNRDSGDGHDPSGPDGLDPQLLQLFEAASRQTPLSAAEHFVAATLLQMRRAARARLLGRCAAVLGILTLGAILAPFIAAVTLDAVSWMADHLAVTGMTLVSPFGCVCAALLAWRIARHSWIS